MEEIVTEQLHLTFDVEDLTFDEMIDIQEGNLRRAKDILAKFVTDANGKKLEDHAAQELLGKVKIHQVRQVFAEFGEQVKAAMEDTLPKKPARS
jgi:hypothetical protein